jgi:hypothetical protein
MSLVNDIRTKLAFLSEKLAKSLDELSEEDRTQYLKMLREVVQTAETMEKNLNKTVECDDSATLRMVGMFPYNANGSFMLPRQEELQQGFAASGVRVF